MEINKLHSIKKLIEKGLLKEAIYQLKKLSDSNKNINAKAVSLIFARYSRLENDIIKGIISNDEAAIETSKINASILDLVSIIEEPNLIVDRTQKRILLAFLSIIIIISLSLLLKHLITKDNLLESVQKQRVSVNYMRLYGALEVPVIMRLITGYSNGNLLNEANVIEESTGSNDCLYCSGHIDQQIVDFWKNDWEYSNAIPFNTYLWENLIDRENVSSLNYSELDLFWTAATINDSPNHNPRRNAWCALSLVAPWKPTPEKIKTEFFGGDNFCDSKFSNNVGFLFLILENNSKDRLNNVHLKFKNQSNEVSLISFPGFGLDSAEFENYIMQISKSDFVNEMDKAIDIDNALQNIDEEQLFLPKMEPNQKFIWILSVYLKDTKGYPLVYLSDVTLPSSLSYELGKRQFSEKIREPAKETAIKVKIPFGWYNQ